MLFSHDFPFFLRKACSSWVVFNSLVHLDVSFATLQQTKPFGKLGWKETKGFSVLRINSHHHFLSVSVVKKKKKAECHQDENYIH